MASDQACPCPLDVSVRGPLKQEQRLRLARWLPLFRSREEDLLPRGESILGELQQLDQQLGQLDQDHYVPALSPALCLLENKVLRHLDQDCTKVMAARSWLANINPLHLLRLVRRGVSGAGHLPQEGILDYGLHPQRDGK